MAEQQRARVYLSHPMLDKTSWVRDQMKKLSQKLHTFADIIDPSDPIRKQPEHHANLVVPRNTSDMLACDFVVAIAFPISAGVAGEVAIARHQAMEIVVLAPEQMKLSAWMRHDTVVVHSVDDVVAQLRITATNPVNLAAVRLRRAEAVFRDTSAALDETCIRVVRCRNDHKSLVHDATERRWEEIRRSTKTTGE